jgi:hypothetical protein
MRYVPLAETMFQGVLMPNSADALEIHVLVSPGRSPFFWWSQPSATESYPEGLLAACGSGWRELLPYNELPAHDDPRICEPCRAAVVPLRAAGFPPAMDPPTLEQVRQHEREAGTMSLLLNVWRAGDDTEYVVR